MASGRKDEASSSEAVFSVVKLKSKSVGVVLVDAGMREKDMLSRLTLLNGISMTMGLTEKERSSRLILSKETSGLGVGLASEPFLLPANMENLMQR